MVWFASAVGSEKLVLCPSVVMRAVAVQELKSCVYFSQ